METWSLATPLDAAPDERVQFIKAAAVARGEWLGVTPPHSPSPAYTLVRVPQVVSKPPVNACFIGKSTVPAGCPGTPETSGRIVTALTYVGRYPPLYYLLIGWPSYLGTKTSIYLMRAMSVLVNAAMLALALAAAYRWSRSALVMPALAVASTPMVFFLASVVNPSGLEITSSIAMWTSAGVLVVDHPRHPPTGLIAVLAASTSTVVLTRGLSPLWPVLCVCVLLPLAWGRLDLRTLIVRKDVLIGMSVVATAVVAAIVWILFAHGLSVVAEGVPSPTTSTTAIIRETIGQNKLLVLQWIGVFGWLDTSAPPLTQLIWLGTTGGLVLLGLLVNSWRAVTSVALAVGLSLGFPIILSTLTARHSGLIAQGRYFLPLAVSVPIVAGLVCSRLTLPQRATTRLTVGIVTLVAIGQIAAAAWALRRYLVGSQGPLSPTATVPGVWRPPLPGWSLDLLFVCSWIVFAVVLIRLSPRKGRIDGDPDRQRDETAQTTESYTGALEFSN